MKLISCPPLLALRQDAFRLQVLLIHLSNLTGLKDDYGKGTMALLVCLLGCLMTGIVASLCKGPAKVWLQSLLLLLAGTNKPLQVRCYLPCLHFY
jgi:hypothetical protein